MKTIKVKEFEVPIGIIADVADILNSKDLTNKIPGTDEEHDFVFLEVNFDRDGEDHTEACREIEDAIEDEKKEHDVMMKKTMIMKRRTGINNR